MDGSGNVGQLNREELRELRLRVERLEVEVAALRQGDVKEVAAPPPPLLMVSEPATERHPLVELPPLVHAPKASLENQLGSQVFNKVGIVALLIGTTWFLKLAIDNHWIGPAGRVLVGLIAGAGIIVWSERFRRQGVTAFSYSLKAVGTGVLYLSLWAAFQLYHLLPAPVALGAMILVTAWNAWMAWSQDAELLAAYALIGGFATPVLLSTGGNHEIFLFTYLLAIDIATVVLVRLKGWPRLLVGSFPATVSFFIGWYGMFFVGSELGITAAFLLLFWVAFISPSVGIASVAGRGPRTPLEAYLSGILLPLGNAAFVALGMYFMLQEAHHHAALPWLMLALAAVYLGIMRLPQGRLASAIHLSLAIVFLTIAVPLKACGHWITVAWLVEGVALFWVATRLASSSEVEGSEAALEAFQADRVLRWLAAGALAPGFCAIVATGFWFDSEAPRSFFSHDVATALVGVAAFAGVAWLAWREGLRRAGSLATVLLSLLAIDVVAVLLALREMLISHFDGTARTAFFNADFATALVGIAVLAAVAYVAVRLARLGTSAIQWWQLAGGSIIALNLVAVLSGVREIESFWMYSAKNPSEGLKQALAVSAFLMVYSAMLLAVGFWKRTAFIRWQGLALLVFTIAKTFLYDMSSLSQGYRVVSFMALGVLLMGVSFAYQKDWLSLKDAPVLTPSAKEDV